MSKTTALKDVAAPIDKYSYLEMNEKLVKYSELEIEISRMWYLTKTLRVVIGALGFI